MDAPEGGSAFEDCFVPTAGLDLAPYIAAGDISACHHIVRYQWACKCLADWPSVSSVLDIACGSGFGPFGIAKTFPEIRVTGVDASPEVVKYAGINYSAGNLQYRVGDAEDLDAVLGDMRFDCAISFETIEHINLREAFLYRMLRHMSPQGRLILSTPVNHSLVARPEWRCHKLEYSFELLFDFLSRYFRRIERPDNGSLPHTEAFRPLLDSGIGYWLMLNPVICYEPILIDNPYS